MTPPPGVEEGRVGATVVIAHRGPGVGWSQAGWNATIQAAFQAFFG